MFNALSRWWNNKPVEYALFVPEFVPFDMIRKANQEHVTFFDVHQVTLEHMSLIDAARYRALMREHNDPYGHHKVTTAFLFPRWLQTIEDLRQQFVADGSRQIYVFVARNYTFLKFAGLSNIRYMMPSFSFFQNQADLFLGWKNAPPGQEFMRKKQRKAKIIDSEEHFVEWAQQEFT
jgi:hypothetical protein